ncbi:MAG TPA: DUF4870 domain-containing protein [Thermoleophilaceae bacterium]|nr:DUF4870 domain-containing protein [Thermoleophilaceae bacterium]
MEAGPSGAPGAQNPPPGWYPDPSVPGAQRWWDGTRWTEHSSAPQPAAVARPTVQQSRQWALFAHLSAFAGLLIGLNFLGPLIIYLVKKNEDPFVADHAREALNFNLSVFIYLLGGGIVAVVLTLVLIGILLFPFLFAIAIAWIVLTIVAAVKANGGETYRYPLTIRFVS